MKPFAKRLLALASAAAITFTTIPAVHAVNTRTTRAMPEAESAEASQDLITTMVRTAFAAAPLTRQGLSTLVMDRYKSITGLTDEDLGQPEYVFIDSDDTNVLNAYHLGLMESQGAAFFGPQGTVSRQDFWAIAAGLLESVGYPYINDIVIDLSVYPDADQLTETASQSIQALICLEVLIPEAGTDLFPADPITYEDAAAVLERIEIFFSQWQEDPVKPQRYLGEEVAEFALNYVGCRYVSGGKGPRNFDCSGLVYYVYKNFGYTLKPGAKTQWSNLGRTVQKEDLLPGDLLFFSKNGRFSGIFHVGIYIGDGQFVHAANSRKGVIVTDMDEAWYSRRYLGAKRAIN